MNLSRSISRGLLWAMIGGAVLAPTIVLAQGAPDTEILDTSCSYLNVIRGWIFSTAYVLGAIGLVLVAVSAFLGRFKFSHLIALGGGLFIVAGADALIRFATGGSGSDTCTPIG